MGSPGDRANLPPLEPSELRGDYGHGAGAYIAHRAAVDREDVPASDLQRLSG